MMRDTDTHQRHHQNNYIKNRLHSTELVIFYHPIDLPLLTVTDWKQYNRNKILFAMFYYRKDKVKIYKIYTGGPFILIGV